MNLYIFRNKLWLTLSGMLLSWLLFHKMTLLNRDISGFRLRIYEFFITTYHHSSATSKSSLEWQWSVHSIATPSLPLHCHATLEWHCSVNLHICDALQCHFGGTLRCHSIATPKVHSNPTPECTLHYHSVTTTAMPLSKYTPMPLRSVFGVLICIFATHSYATPMPLQYHPIRSGWHCSVHSGLWK